LIHKEKSKSWHKGGETARFKYPDPREATYNRYPYLQRIYFDLQIIKHVSSLIRESRDRGTPIFIDTDFSSTTLSAIP
jgi:hypothetical protein